ncbi:hypothetical protein [Paludisphaera mucosa]|uniref:Knr4/Smi1-like domain-containing protein n=1 Tax=Paludisphaera mucosa TaxID=3030827 RepID=A0ABT6FCZ8_9BACT|nr:hypothetical protein [Paludisphaera mucosa]MDG3005468.1 hypothetical protein [Paludisphaera mucosa]
MSTDFSDLRDAIHRVWPDTALETLSAEEVASIGREHLGIPEHYTAFLRLIGWGSLGPGAFMFYSGPVAAEEVFGPAPALSGVWLVGDDFAGWCLGMDSRAGWSLVGVDDHRHGPLPEASPDIATFVADRLAAEADT